MAQRKTALNTTNRPVKLFRNGGSQAVRLPADFRFDGDTVYASRDEATGDVTLSQKPREKSWDRLFAILDEMRPVPEDFMAERPLNVPFRHRNVFDDVDEDGE